MQSKLQKLEVHTYDIMSIFFTLAYYIIRLKQVLKDKSKCGAEGSLLLSWFTVILPQNIWLVGNYWKAIHQYNHNAVRLISPPFNNFCTHKICSSRDDGYGCNWRHAAQRSEVNFRHKPLWKKILIFIISQTFTTCNGYS